MKQHNSFQICHSEVVLRPVFVHHQTFGSEDFPYPAIDLAAYILVYYNPRDSGKAGEEKFGNGAYRVCSRYVDYCRTAGRNLEAEEVFYRS